MSGPMAYGPVSDLATMLGHVAGCAECRAAWPLQPAGLLAMRWQADGHVAMEVDGAAAAGGGAALLADSSSDPTAQDSRQDPIRTRSASSFTRRRA